MTTTNTKKTAKVYGKKLMAALREITQAVYDENGVFRYQNGILKRQAPFFLERTGPNHSRWIRFDGNAE